MAMSAEYRLTFAAGLSPAMMTSPYEWKILECYEKPQQTNKQIKQTNKRFRYLMQICVKMTLWFQLKKDISYDLRALSLSFNYHIYLSLSGKCSVKLTLWFQFRKVKIVL